jgi:hypothetical protein
MGVAITAHTPLTPREHELGILATLGTPRFQPAFALYAHRRVAAGPSVGLTPEQIGAAVQNGFEAAEGASGEAKTLASDTQDSWTDEQVEKRLVAAGITGEAERATWRLARAAARSGGHLDDHVWMRAERALGKAKCAAIVHLVGWYSYASTLLNSVQADVPLES